MRFLNELSRAHFWDCSHGQRDSLKTLGIIACPNCCVPPLVPPPSSSVISLSPSLNLSSIPWRRREKSRGRNARRTLIKLMRHVQCVTIGICD